MLSARWTTRDPVLYTGCQANLYAYVGSDPISFRDPLELWCVGRSLYAIVGFGASVRCNSGGLCSACTEAGLGWGADLSIGAGGVEEPGYTDTGKAGFGREPIGGASVTCKYTSKCGLGCEPSISVGPMEFSGPEGSASVNPMGLGVPEKIKCGIQGKVARQRCERF